MTTELETLGDLIWLKRMLVGGRAKKIVKDAGLSTAAVGEILGCAQPTAWLYLAGRRFPQRVRALKLAKLLHSLEIIDRAL